MLRLCVDIDNVVAQTDIVIRRLIAELSDGGVNYEYSDITDFKYQNCSDCDGASATDELWARVHHKFSQSEILGLEMVPRSKECLTKLAPGFKIHFATSRLPAARLATVQWLDGCEFPFSYDLHFVGHGEKHAVLDGFAAIIEDNLSEALAFARSGTCALVIPHPWNEGQVPPSLTSIVHRADWDELTHRLTNR